VPAFQRPGGQTMCAFLSVVRGAGVNVHVRKSRGREIAAACGQLARQDRGAGRAQGSTINE
jgi:23S rRNA (adenine2503-C2)-methyltransferase